MKKFLICSLLAAVLLAGANYLPAAEPLLKVAVLSDIQHYDQPGDWGYGNLEKAFAMLQNRQIGVLVIAGDLVENANHPGAFKSYRALMKKYFKNNMPELVACAGNHDVYNNPLQPVEKCLDVFCRNLQIPRDNPLLQNFQGFDFITVHDERTDDYCSDTLQKLQKLLDQAVQRSKDKPVFVVSHYPLPDTVAGSFGSKKMHKLRKVLNKYPQVVHLSGHTHYPLEDERAIWQKEFTAITTSTLSYGCLDDKIVSNTCNGILPFAREVVQFMIFEIYADRIVIARYNAEEKREIKPAARWVIDLPYKPSEAKYTEARAAGRTAPAFPENARLLLRYDYGFHYLIFDAAKHDDMVFMYKIRVLLPGDKSGWQEHYSENFVAGFYRLERTRGKRESFRLPEYALVNNKLNRIEVYPVENFGKAGKPLVLEYPMPALRSAAKVPKNIAPQD